MKRDLRIRALLQRLPGMYPDARCLLDYDGDPEKLLISTILSARTTDAAVNRAAPRLWREVIDIKGLAGADTHVLEEILHPLGFFRAKAGTIRKAAAWLVEHGGIPDTVEELTVIPGVGRKTANVVAGEAFGKPAMIVDTHVSRLAGRLDLTRVREADRIEMRLRAMVPEDMWTSFSHQLGFHGRRVCASRKPSCDSCLLNDICPKRGVGAQKKHPAS